MNAFTSGAASGASVGSIIPGVGTAFGALLGGVAGALLNKKKAPPVVPYKPVAGISLNAQDEQNKAIGGNLASQGDLESLLARGNQFNQTQASQLLEQAAPGYGKLSSSITALGTKAAENPYALPKDVQDNLTRIAAERGVKVGSQGQTREFSALRDLGVNMLDYGNSNFSKALQALQTVTGTAPRVSPMSPLSFYLTPQQQFQQDFGVAGANTAITTNNNTMQQNIAQGGANAATAASNWNTGNAWQSLLTAIFQPGAFGATPGK